VFRLLFSQTEREDIAMMIVMVVVGDES